MCQPRRKDAIELHIPILHGSILGDMSSEVMVLRVEEEKRERRRHVVRGQMSDSYPKRFNPIKIIPL